MNTGHEFYNGTEYNKDVQKSSRTSLRKNEGTFSHSGVGARSVFGMDEKPYVLDMLTAQSRVT